MIEVKKALRALVQKKPQSGKEEDPSWLVLSRNESHFGVSPKVREALSGAADTISLYPENTGWALRQGLAALYGISPEKILLGNGSFELIWLIASVYLGPGDESILPAATFGAYRKYTEMTGAGVISVPLHEGDIDLEKILSHVTDRTKIIWLCNPNNPTGRYIPEEKIRRFLQQVPSHVLVALDEAYIEFTEGYDPKRSVEILKDIPNLLLLRTFSKFYGLASLRIGYAMGSEEIIDTLFQFRIGPNHSRIAEKAALVSIEDQAFQAAVRERYQKEKEALYTAFQRLGIPFWRTETNFILFRLPGIPAAEAVKDFGMARIRVRDAAVFGLPGWVRLSFGNESDHRYVLSVLSDILASARRGV